MSKAYSKRERFLVFIVNLLLPKHKKQELLSGASAPKAQSTDSARLSPTVSNPKSAPDEKAQDCINRVHRLAANQKPAILAQAAMDNLSALMIQHSVLRKRLIQMAGNFGSLHNIDGFLGSVDGIESVRSEIDQIQSALVFLSHLNCNFDTPAIEEIEVEIEQVRKATKNHPETVKSLVFLRAEDRV